jgi:hypothetical protein
MLARLRLNSTAAPMASWSSRKAAACSTLTAPLGKGRNRVRATWAS